MDIRIYKAPLDEDRYGEYIEFLERAGLRDEGDSDIIAQMRDDEGRLSGCGSLAGHTLKQFAVAPALEGRGAMAEIMSRLIEEAYAAGRSRLFLCTKPANTGMIRSLGFYPLVQTDDAVLMENRRGGLERFLDNVREDAKEYAQLRGRDLEHMICGAVVCNCDPFTLGHRALMEHAADSCDFLYVFAVSEPGSMFDPGTRLEMIKRGTSGIDNCRVYESELYLVSRATFPAYFIRDEKHADEVRADIDIKLFAERIAPALNISRRFVGTEPFSPVTDAYNKRMKELLPQYGIELSEMQRLEVDSGDGDMPVSASRVRAMLAEGDRDAARELLPATTYDLIEKFLHEDNA